MNLKPDDYKLLAYLYHNNRESYAKIAKATNLTREQVQYKIKNYLSEGLIRKFATLPNYSAFEYKRFVILLVKLKQDKKDAFVSKLSKYPNCLSWGYTYAKYDIYINLIFKDDIEMHNFLKSEDSIQSYEIILPTYTALYPLKSFHDFSSEEVPMISDSPIRKFDATEQQMLQMLQKDYRTRIIDMAFASKASSELIMYKLKKLHDDKIILGSRMQFDMNKIGYYFTAILITADFSEVIQKRVKQHCKSSRHINSLIIQINAPQYIIQIFHQSEKELRQSIDGIKKIFPENINMEVLPIGEDAQEINTLPFVR